MIADNDYPFSIKHLKAFVKDKPTKPGSPLYFYSEFKEFWELIDIKETSTRHQESVITIVWYPSAVCHIRMVPLKGPHINATIKGDDRTLSEFRVFSTP